MFAGKRAPEIPSAEEAEKGAQEDEESRTPDYGPIRPSILPWHNSSYVGEAAIGAIE
jgi:hypothetical protein